MLRLKLSQVLATEKTIKSRTYGEITEIHKANQKPGQFGGFNKTYRRKDEEGETYPDEKQIVQKHVDEVTTLAAKNWGEMFDITATKDYGNMTAKADIVVDDNVLIPGVPVTFLLFLEKQFLDVRKFLTELPVLDPAETWTKDTNSGLFKTDPIPTQRTKKVPKAFELAKPTKEHPAQVHLFTEDVVVGYWDTIKLSGAIPAPRKKELVARIDKLIKAVQTAREEANSLVVETKEVGQPIFDYLLG